MSPNADSAKQSQQKNDEATNELEDEIVELEQKLNATKLKLQARRNASSDASHVVEIPRPISASNHETPHHYLLLLSDSALPLGSFAFSSGLESYLAHTPTSSISFTHFLTLSLASYASTTLPFVLAAYRNPLDLLDLDDGLDAAIMCTVGRRASVAQGRALLGVWERSLLPSLAASRRVENGKGIEVLKNMSALVRRTPSDEGLPYASAHLPPLFGSLSALLGLSLEQTAYVYLLSHVKALLSAAVRASIFGPYQAQKVLAGEGVQGGISREIERNWSRNWVETGQVVPVLDLWVGRHEMLYSRIFNS